MALAVDKELCLGWGVGRLVYGEAYRVAFIKSQQTTTSGHGHEARRPALIVRGEMLQHRDAGKTKRQGDTTRRDG
jgi:hypothetical protein